MNTNQLLTAIQDVFPDSLIKIQQQDEDCDARIIASISPFNILVLDYCEDEPAAKFSELWITKIHIICPSYGAQNRIEYGWVFKGKFPLLGTNEYDMDFFKKIILNYENF